MRWSMPKQKNALGIEGEISCFLPNSVLAAKCSDQEIAELALVLSFCDAFRQDLLEGMQQKGGRRLNYPDLLEGEQQEAGGRLN